LALRTANHIGAHYILAQDPDADRFSAGEKELVYYSQFFTKGLLNFDSSPKGEWNIFTGDQIGIIFASKIFQDYQLSDQPLDKLAMVASTVSSKMLARMAEMEGFKFSECLTGTNSFSVLIYSDIQRNLGFKFIGNTALQLSKQGYSVLFAYEEAIGFMFGQHIHDKDGIAATVRNMELIFSLYLMIIQIQFVKLVYSLQAQNKTVQQYLNELYNR